MMKKALLNSFCFCLLALMANAQIPLDTLLPVRGFSIAAPGTDGVDEFISFIREDLVPKNVNTLILRVDYNYQYKSHPELQDEEALTKEDVKKIVDACRNSNIRIIPQINLLGHQSWHTNLEGLLRVYPEFDETPHIELPEEYKWPNEDGLYCKSYCPLHPEVHKIVFELVDELVEVYEADAFHAGMDEVFYIGDDQCPRCSGRDKAELFAGEVTKIRNHLNSKGWELWIWGDRLIDGKTTGMGMWEASMNNTYRAIDIIPKDVVICDWHYERADATAAYFAIKGFRVVTCPYRKPEVAIDQLDLMLHFRKSAKKKKKDNYYGMVQTIWTSPENFLDAYYGRNTSQNRTKSSVDCFNTLFDAINNR